MQVLHRAVTSTMPAFSLEAAGREDVFAVLGVTLSEVQPPRPAELRLWMYQVRSQDIVPAPAFVDAPEGRFLAVGSGCPFTAAGTSTSPGGGRLLVVSDHRAGCVGEAAGVGLGTYLTVTDLDGHPIEGVPERILGRGTFSPEQGHAPRVVLRDKLFVVLHDLDTSVPHLYRHDVAALIAPRDAAVMTPTDAIVEPDAGFPKGLGVLGAEIMNRTATPTSLHFGFRLGSPNLTTTVYSRLDVNGESLLPPWPSLPAQGSGRIQPLPDGRVLVVGSGYWDHTVYAALLGCP